MGAAKFPSFSILCDRHRRRRFPPLARHAMRGRLEEGGGEEEAEGGSEGEVVKVTTIALKVFNTQLFISTNFLLFSDENLDFDPYFGRCSYSLVTFW